VLPDELTDSGIFWYSFVTAVASFRARGGSFDAAVVHEGPGNVRDFWFEDKGDVFVKNGDRVSPTHRQTSESYSAEWGLDGCEVARRNVKGAVVVAHEEI
jgi:hypothetical protein